MDASNLQGSLDRLQQILAGRTMKDLLSNVDTSKILQTTQPDGSKLPKNEDPMIPLSEKIAKTKDEEKDKEKKKKKKKKEKKEKKDDKDKDKKKKNKNLRYAAGEVWEDQTMADWPENDFRIFVGNLGNEVSDEMLALAFRKYSSFNRAKVVRDSKTSKTKGYGFVSIQKPEDYMKAMKEMDGQYIGNRPVKLTRSKWKERGLEANKDELRDANFKKLKK